MFAPQWPFTSVPEHWIGRSYVHSLPCGPIIHAQQTDRSSRHQRQPGPQGRAQLHRITPSCLVETPPSPLYHHRPSSVAAENRQPHTGLQRQQGLQQPGPRPRSSSNSSPCCTRPPTGPGSLQPEPQRLPPLQDLPLQSHSQTHLPGARPSVQPLLRSGMYTPRNYRPRGSPTRSSGSGAFPCHLYPARR